MKNIIKLLFLLFIISISSCRRCRDCSREVRYINGAHIVWCTNYVKLLGYIDFAHYLSTNYPSRQRFCGNELREAKDWYAVALFFDPLGLPPSLFPFSNGIIIIFGYERIYQKE